MEKRVGNVRLMQKINRLKILNFVRENKFALRPEMAEKTGLSLSSVTNIITYLIGKNIVVSDGSVAEGRVGRRPDLIRFKNDYYNFVCIMIDKNEFTVAFTDLEGKALEKATFKIGENRDALMNNIINETNKIIDRCGRKNLLGVCMSISALVLENGIYSADLNWELKISRAELKEKLGVPVFLENVSDMRGVWQFKGRVREMGNVVLFDLEGGIGAVHFANGERSRFAIGEIGHTTVASDGDKCVCGNYGCLEAMCSTDKIVKSCEKLGCKSFDDVVAMFDDGREEVIPALDLCAEYLGIGLANVANMFNPERIVVNCGEYAKCSYIINKAVKVMYIRANKLLTDSVKIEKVSFSGDDIIKGMAMFMCDEIFSLDFEDEFIEL